jgi:RNA polymerase sigma-70 factor (ECF subfamily)
LWTLVGLKGRDLNHNTDNEAMVPDESLMLAFREGDEEAFVTLYRRYRDRIVSFSRRLLGDAATAEEAAQDTFVKLYGARRRYHPTSKFSTFLYRIATNHCLNIRARAERRYRAPGTAVEAKADPAALNPEDSADRARLREALWQAIAALPAKQAGALVLCHYEGMSLREASQVLHVTDGAVKSLLHRARQRLQSDLAWTQNPEREVRHAVP